MKIASRLPVIQVSCLCAILALPCKAQEYALSVARVKYGGGGDWYSDEKSLPELLAHIRAETLVNVNPTPEIVELSNDRLFTFPYLYLTGHGNVVFTEKEITRLRQYLEQGGFLHIDDNYGLDEAIRREMKKVFPKQEFAELPFGHAIYHTHYSFPNGLPKIHEHDGKPPQGLGLFDQYGRLCVFYSYESDLGDGWEPESVHDLPPETRKLALQMGTNILVYALMGAS